MYESNDPTPVRPRANSSSVPLEPAPRVSVPPKPAPLESEALPAGPVSPVRKGDFDLTPPRPSAEVLRTAQEKAERLRQEPVGAAAPEEAPSHVPDNRFLRMTATICLCLVGIWLVGILTDLCRNIAAAQTIPGIVWFSLLLAAQLFLVAYVFVSVRRIFVRLPTVPQLREKDFIGQEDALRDKIKKEYLATFPDPSKYVAEAQFQGDPAREARDKLARLREHRYAGANDFVRDFEAFQSMQDERAAEVIKHHAVLIGLKTAASPWKIVDMLAVFYNGTIMICRIATVYHRKTTRAEAFRLILRWFANIYVSGELGAIAEGASDTIAQTIGNWIGKEGFGPLLQSSAPMLSKFVGKAAEGSANAYLAYRLGRKACSYFRAMER